MSGGFDKTFSDLLSEGKNLAFEQVTVSMKAWIISEAFLRSGRDVLVLTEEGQEESRLVQNIEFFVSTPTIELPSWETLPSEKVAPSSDIVGARHKSLQAIAHRTSPRIVISSLQASLQKMLTIKTLQEKLLTITQGEELPFDLVVEQIMHLGYERRPVVLGKGEFAVRGGLVDIFCVTENKPIRIEFSGDLVESLRFFDPLSQRTHESIASVTIPPGKEREHLEQQESLTNIFALLGSKCLVILDNIETLEDRYASLASTGPSKIFMDLKEWLERIQKAQLICCSHSSLEALSEVRRDASSKIASYSDWGADELVHFSLFNNDFSLHRINHPCRHIAEYYASKCLLDSPPEGEQLLDCLIQLQEVHPHTIIVQSLVELEWLKQKITNHGGSLLLSTTIKEGTLSSGFARLDDNTIYFSTTDITGRTTVRRDSSRVSSLITQYDAYDLTPNEFVVHFHHGLGIFRGIEKRPDSQGREQEFFVIEYAEKSTLFVPLAQAHLITKYVGGKEEQPKLNVLGTNRWKRLREDTEKAIVGYAAELLQLQANRVLKGGFSFQPDGVTMQLFEAEFPYTETEDQLKAIADIKRDMCSDKAMDRLVCGDVGYGKTEVAMRAAFKAVVDGKKQVALLAPTTVLALQHYENFVERMSPFGVNIGVLYRFATPKQNKATVEKVQQGEIDIVIGTHRLLQKDVLFKDLGLVIVDEEQRFGVKSKEHLKILKEGVDCLTMTATPIPRTLYLALIGAKDLSTISTPPHDRLPIKTIVTESSQELLQTALLRELNRGGQAFFIHNRVETIFEAADRVRKVVPRARIAVAHGQMDADALDTVFHAFKKGDIDILVSTSIVENGIDIPNANTLIVDRADHFGVAELYQLRGRVGRWNRRAYAYFLIPPRMLSDIARKRIDAIAQAGGYGGGMRVAMRDLELRGAGSILGLEQSGHIIAIGFHLYCKLLRRTVDALTGKGPSPTLETKVDIPFNAKLPEGYVNEVSLRMEFYQRFGEARSSQEVDAITEELKDRFGPLPEPALWLIHMTKVRVYAALKGISSLKLETHSLVIEKKTKEASHTNRILMPRISTPIEFENAVLQALQKMEVTPLATK
jgi:transcription-repair coupling factor (superfamily II helicase)